MSQSVAFDSVFCITLANICSIERWRFREIRSKMLLPRIRQARRLYVTPFNGPKRIEKYLFVQTVARMEFEIHMFYLKHRRTVGTNPKHVEGHCCGDQRAFRAIRRSRVRRIHEFHIPQRCSREFAPGGVEKSLEKLRRAKIPLASWPKVDSPAMDNRENYVIGFMREIKIDPWSN